MALSINNLDAGDDYSAFGREVTITGDGNVSKGDPLTFDGSGNVTTATSTTANLIGVAGEVESDNEVSVKTAGYIVAVKADSSANVGSHLVPSGTNSGNFTHHHDSNYYPDADGDDVPASHPIALTGASSDGDLILSLWR